MHGNFEDSEKKMFDVNTRVATEMLCLSLVCVLKKLTNITRNKKITKQNSSTSRLQRNEKLGRCFGV